LANQSRQLNEASKTNRMITVALAAIVLVFGVFTFVLWRAHFFTQTASDSSSKLVAQALTLVGGLVGAIVSILGILLRYSMDRQTEARQQEAEDRLKLEAATRVIQLFVNGDGRQAPATQIAGGLLTLSSLGQHSLALVLTADLLRREKIDGSTACEVIGQALQQNSEEIQISAISVMVNYPAAMITDNGVEIPKPILNWECKKLCVYVREWAPVALGDIMTKRPLATWREQYPYDAYGAIGALALGWLHESDPQMKYDIGVILNCLLDAFPDSGVLFHPLEAIDTDKIRLEVKDLQSPRSQVRDVVERLKTWKNGADQGASPNLSASPNPLKS